jgi:hypothetical protein
VNSGGFSVQRSTFWTSSNALFLFKMTLRKLDSVSRLGRTSPCLRIVSIRLCVKITCHRHELSDFICRFPRFAFHCESTHRVSVQNVKIPVVSYVTPCSVAERYQRFWEFQCLPKRRYSSARLHCVRSQKTRIFIGNAVRTSNPV